MALTPASAGAQPQAEVDDARSELAAAAESLSAATARLTSDLATQDALSVSLVDTLAALDEATIRLASASYDAIATRQRIEDLEATVRELRGSADDAIAAAYIRSAGTPVGLFGARTHHQVLVLGSLVDSSVGEARDAVAAVTGSRWELDRTRADYETQSRELRTMRTELDAAGAALELALGEAGRAVALAFDEVAAADARHRDAETELEEAERRLAALRGVAHWLPLVERYFPAERVEEAMQVMRCESNGRPDAVNPTSDATGLFQFKAATWAWASVGAGFGGSSRLEPEANIASAAWLLDYSIRTDHPAGAWGHWECKPSVPVGRG